MNDFILFYAFLIVVGTLCVTGWHFVTRGYEQVLPDGSIYKYGQIFKDWYFFWTKTRDKKELYFYTKSELLFFYKEIESELQKCFIAIENKSVQLNIVQNVEGKCIIANNAIANDFEIELLEKKYNIVLFLVNIDPSSIQIAIAKQYNDYVFPWYIRKPLAECATCFASVYGSLFYWGVIALVDSNKLFAVFTYQILAKIFFWVVFCLTLSVTNTAVAKINN